MTRQEAALLLNMQVTVKVFAGYVLSEDQEHYIRLYFTCQVLTRKLYVSKLRIYIALENFFTFDHLGTFPIDPEEIEGYSMWNTSNYNLGRSGVGVPTYKTASFGIQLNF